MLHDERKRAAAELVAATSALLSPVHGEDLVAAYQRFERARAQMIALTTGSPAADDDPGADEDSDAEG